MTVQQIRQMLISGPNKFVPPKTNYSWKKVKNNLNYSKNQGSNSKNIVHHGKLERHDRQFVFTYTAETWWQKLDFRKKHVQMLGLQQLWMLTRKQIVFIIGVMIKITYTRL
jgi:hypothetical protein